MNVSTCCLYCIFDAVAFLFVFFSFTFNFPNFLIELKCITFYFVFILYHIKMKNKRKNVSMKRIAEEITCMHACSAVSDSLRHYGL